MLGILGFTWIELVFAQSGFQAVGLTPHTVAIAVLAYSGITFVGMALFGIDEWLDRGEAFSVYFNMFSRLAPLEVARRHGWAAAAGSRGRSAGPRSRARSRWCWSRSGRRHSTAPPRACSRKGISSTFDWLYDSVGVGAIWSLRLANSLFFVITLRRVWPGSSGPGSRACGRSARRTGDLGAGELGRLFGHSFIPIALAYLVAHYFSLFVFQEQAQFTYLLSDPLGNGSDYLRHRIRRHRLQHWSAPRRSGTSRWRRW